MILCRYEPGESDVVVEYNEVTAVFTATLPFSIYLKRGSNFVNEVTARLPTEMIGFLWELEKQGFLVPADIIETLRQISHRSSTGGSTRFRPRARARTDLKLVA